MTSKTTQKALNKSDKYDFYFMFTVDAQMSCCGVWFVSGFFLALEIVNFSWDLKPFSKPRTRPSIRVMTFALENTHKTAMLDQNEVA